MGAIERSIHDLYEHGESRLGHLWPVWIVGVFFYAAVSYVLLTRVALPSPLHFFVYTMGAAIVVLTVLNVEWAVLGLVTMTPFARPGMSFGPEKVFHLSGFNFALAGVLFVYALRYFTDRGFASKGPFVRRTPIDRVMFAFLLLVTFSAMIGLATNELEVARTRLLLYYKEQVLYVAWFYLLVTLLRKPSDIRRFAIFFAISGLLVSLLGLYNRVTGAVAGATATAAELEAGAVGGQTAGGWLGLAHPNFFAAFLLLSFPIWFFIVDYLRRAGQKVFAYVAILVGFLGLLFTYSRSAWGGTLAGLGILGLGDRRALVRILIFLVLFAVVAQTASVALTGMGVVDLVRLRFEQLGRSQYSGRFLIYSVALGLINDHPLTGVGLGAYPWHGQGAWEGARNVQAHNLFLTLAAEQGLVVTALFAALVVVIFVMATRNLIALRHDPGYGFLARASYVGLVAIMTQSLFVHIFYHRDVGYAFYAMLAIVVSLNRMVREGLLPETGAAARPRRV